MGLRQRHPLVVEPPRLLERIFPADFGERRAISEDYVNSYSFT